MVSSCAAVSASLFEQFVDITNVFQFIGEEKVAAFKKIQEEQANKKAAAETVVAAETDN